MESLRWLLVLLLGVFAIVRLVQAQDQQGFISLDCGLPVSEPSPYNEPLTGLRFSSDAKFIQTGKSGKIQANLVGDYLKPYARLRYFPDERRNCYTLSVEKDRRYLIRAGFMYGNYDGLNSNPTFDLHLGPNLWATIDLQKFVNGTMEEIIHTPTSSSLQVCLVKTGTTTPLISALELRPLDNRSFPTKSGSLKLFVRIYLNKTLGTATI
ncbi:unnamed protein product [Thlaspi arvense]|uniref:Malectin-like domain-containing protein n=1 Tax=Thlaspi arvense TaxID=13288 RepID=A0AAU9SLS4_THLAR|nr:unnamed protein product [Thlaspi arvense]